MSRKLVTIRKIDDILPIPDADNIECAVIGGWEVVVKKNEFKPGDYGIYFEIDSWIPHYIAPFLTKSGNPPKEYLQVPGQRLKTIRLRKQISQGLVLPFTVEYANDPVLPEEGLFTTTDGLTLAFDPKDTDTDLTELFGVTLWELPDKGIQGSSKGNFPGFFPKTDQERIQNLSRWNEKWLEEKHVFEVTEKLDGSSMSVYYRRGMGDPDDSGSLLLGVCSRNVDLIREEGNNFWDTAEREELLNKVMGMSHAMDKDLVLQGELVGESIQGNRYQLKGHTFYLYDVYNITDQVFLLPAERQRLARAWKIQHVPFINAETTMPMKELLSSVDESSRLYPKVIQEGVVYKSMVEHDRSFKVISNAYLLEKG
jgi:RNA ligase (TIGR02306 family)